MKIFRRLVPGMFWFPALILGLVGLIVGGWGASLFLRALASRVEAVASRIAVRRGKRSRPPLGNRQRWAGLLSGPLLVIGGVCVLAMALRVYEWRSEEGPTEWSLWTIASGVLGLFGLMGLFIAWQYDPARGRRRCPKCWYELAGVPGLRCPECGHEAKAEAGLLVTRRSGWMALMSAAVIAGAGVLQRAPMMEEHGWMGAVPTTAMIAGLWWMPDRLIWGTDPGDYPLTDRVDNQNLSSWQQRWLQSRVRQRAKSATSVEDVHRIYHFRGEYEDVDLDRFLPSALRQLNSTDAEERVKAVAAAGESTLHGERRHPDLDEIIRKALADPVQMVRAHGASYLRGYSADPGPLIELMRPYASGGSPTDVWMMTAGIAEIAFDPRQRGWSEESRNKAIAVLEELESGPDPQGRAAAIGATRYAGGERWKAATLRGMRDPDPLVVSWAAQLFVVKAGGRSEVFDVILPVITDPKTDRATIFGVFERHARELWVPPQVAAVVTDALRDGDPRTQLAAAKLLGALGQSAAGELDAIQAVVDDDRQPAEVRQAAANAFVKIKDVLNAETVPERE